MAEKKLGVITHYFDHLGVGIVKASGKVKVGDKVHVKGHTTDFEQEITEMQLDHKTLTEAKKGQEVGVKLAGLVREGDEIYLAE